MVVYEPLKTDDKQVYPSGVTGKFFKNNFVKSNWILSIKLSLENQLLDG